MASIACRNGVAREGALGRPAYSSACRGLGASSRVERLLGLGGLARRRAWKVVALRTRARDLQRLARTAPGRTRTEASSHIVGTGPRASLKPHDSGEVRATYKRPASLGETGDGGEPRARAENETPRCEQSVAADNHLRSPRCAGSLRSLPLNADVGPQGLGVRESHFRVGSAYSAWRGMAGSLGRSAARRLLFPKTWSHCRFFGTAGFRAGHLTVLGSWARSAIAGVRSLERRRENEKISPATPLKKGSGGNVANILQTR